MNILKKTPDSNGAHKIQRGVKSIPDGWAEISDVLAGAHIANKCFSIPTYSAEGTSVASLCDNPAARDAFEAAQETEPPPPPPTAEDQIAALQAENKTLAAQMQATSELMDFYEECIVETAMIVYA